MVEEIFIKKGYDEEDEYIIIYLHFCGEYAMRQMDVYPNKIIKSSLLEPVFGIEFLYDQKYSDIAMEFEPEDFISREEFELKWNQ